MSDQSTTPIVNPPPVVVAPVVVAPVPTSPPPCDIIAEITQSIIAVILVGGGGIAALTGSVHTNEILPFMALVVGFYFGRTKGRQQANEVNAKGITP